MQIVIAWAEKTRLVPTGRTVTRDLNSFPEFRTDWEGKAAMWLNSGSDEDLAKARKYAADEGKLVLTFFNESAPLEKARAYAERHHPAE